MYKNSSFNDSHMHFLGIGFNINDLIDIEDSISIIDMINTLKGYTTKNIIIARGWNQFQFIEKRYPTKQDLNHIKKPVVLIRTCGHVLICNDAMMKLANVKASTTQVEGGTFDFNTGVFTENALELIYSVLPTPSKEDIKKHFISSNKHLLSQGITSIGSDDFSTLNVPYELIIECLKELYAEEKIQVRLYEQVNLPTLELLNDYINKGYHKKRYKGFKLGPLKILADGSLGARTAYLNQPYADDKSTQGIEAFSQSQLNDLIYLADSNNIDVAVHAIGDGMIDNVIEAIEISVNKTKRFHHRHSVIHAQLATRKQIKKMKDLNIVAQVQPIFLNSDIAIVKDRLGDRSKESYLFNSMDKEGVIVTFGTDAPVETVNPYHNLYSSITRKSIKDPQLEPFLKEEAFTLKNALKCYIQTPYYLSYDEDSYKDFNDYIIVDRDINNCTIEELKDTVVLETYISGKLVYKK